VFDLRSDALRPAGWTSADAAGLPILPRLARYDEAASGVIGHALRITVPRTQSAYVWSARHEASSDGDASLPPIGQAGSSPDRRPHLDPGPGPGLIVLLGEFGRIEP